MKGRYSIKSDSFQRIHAFTKADKGDNFYWFETENPWMTTQVTYTEIDGKIAFIDADGGPIISPGWYNDEIEVLDISLDENNRILCELKERS